MQSMRPAQKATTASSDESGIVRGRFLFAWRPRPSAAVLFVAMLAFPAALSAAARASAQDRFYEQDSYDLVTITWNREETTLKVLPIDFPGRIVPRNPRPPDNAKLTIRLVDQPEKKRQVRWRYVVKVELFEELVLAEAKKLVAAGKFNQAYDYYDFLIHNYPNMPGLDAATADYLYHDAAGLFKAGQSDEALALLEEAYRLDPDRPGLAAALDTVGARIIQAYRQKGNYAAARKLLRRGLDRNPKEKPEKLVALRQEFIADAAQRMQKAQEDYAAGRFRDAHAAAREMMQIWPEVDGGDRLVARIEQQYARVVVGVSQLAAAGDPRQIGDRAARRTGRLLHRMLVEQTGLGAAGGEYDCPPGTLSVGEDGKTLAIRLRPQPDDNGPTGYDVSRRLLAMADPASATCRPGWAERLSGVSVENVYTVRVELRRPHVRPEALLQMILASPNADAAGVGILSAGPFIVASESPREVCFLAKPKSQYALAGPTEPNELVEQRFDKSWRAVEALEDGQIDVLADVYPADVERLKADKSLVVGSYAAPSIHVLVPNYDKPLPANRDFRRALVYALDRRAILDTELLEGAEIDGCRVISGPLPAGTSPEDPLGYAYDRRIAPRAHEPLLARMLVLKALRDIAAAREKRSGVKNEKRETTADEKTPPNTGRPAGSDAASLPSLVLGHPDAPLPRIACQAIARQLKKIGLSVSLTPLPPGMATDPDSRCDLVYAEFMMAEPAVDAPRLLGRDGIAHSNSPYVDQALRGLGQARNWDQARARLYDIHRLTHDEATVIPLWQLVDHFAYHRRLRGIGRKPLNLYQNIEKWQLMPHAAGP